MATSAELGVDYPGADYMGRVYKTGRANDTLTRFMTTLVR